MYSTNINDGSGGSSGGSNSKKCIITRMVWSESGKQLWIGMETGELLLCEVNPEFVEVRREMIDSLRRRVEKMLADVKAREDRENQKS